MRIEISVAEVVSIFKEIQQNPEQIFQMIRLDVKEIVGRYLSETMHAELIHCLGRERYERKDAGEAEAGGTNYRNGSYERRLTLKGIGEVSTKISQANAKLKEAVEK